METVILPCNTMYEIPRNHLPKEAKVLYPESYKMLMQEIEDNRNRWKEMPCSWVERINVVKISILPKAIY